MDAQQLKSDYYRLPNLRPDALASLQRLHDLTDAAGFARLSARVLLALVDGARRHVEAAEPTSRTAGALAPPDSSWRPGSS